MDDAGERRQLRVHAYHHRVERRSVRYIRQFHLDPDSLRAQGLNGFHSLGIGIPTAVQHDYPRTLVRQPLRHGATDTAQSARHQVGAILPQLVAHQWLRR